MDCIYTDIRKAFDRVPVDLLLRKLGTYYNIGEPLLSCLQSFLKNRSQQVTINGYTSFSFPVSSGVGQGTHLGPVLFLLFINDVKFVFKSSRFLLFADDCKIFCKITSFNDSLALQDDLDAFVEWCRHNGLELNVDKCKHMKFSRQLNPPPFSYFIDNARLETVTCVNDLGIYLDSKLNYNSHIDHVAARSNKLLGFIVRTSRPFTSFRCVHLLFVALVRPVIEYCSIIWAPSYNVHINRLESIQKKFLKFMCYKFGVLYVSDNYHQLLRYFSLQPLLQRRQFCDIMFFFKVLNNLIRCSQISDLFSLHVPSLTLRSTPLLAVDFHRTNYGLHSSLCRIANGVNHLDLDEGKLNCGLYSFRSRLRNLIYE